MRVALVHDYLVQYGGAERVLESLCEIFPDAPVYTLIYDKDSTSGAFDNRKIRTSWLQKIPLARSHHRLFPILMPMAIESFDLSGFDLVISDSNSFAKGILTKPETLHICYCHTPIRYGWDDSHKYIKEFHYSALTKKFVPFMMNYIRLWDKISDRRPDRYIANSNFVAKRIKKYYSQSSEIIYPPVDIKKYYITKNISDYFLMVGRLLPYKRFDIAIEAFNRIEIPLKIIGEGPEIKRLKKKARSNIEFLGRLNDKQIKDYYAQCRALIFPQEEDFGIVALEAMASGRPVIAFRGGGALETIEEEKTGVFFNEQTPESLMEAVKNFNQASFNPEAIRQHALGFDKEIFKEKIEQFIEKAWKEFENS